MTDHDNRSVTDSLSDRSPIGTDPSVHRSHGRTDGLTKNYSPQESISPNAARTKAEHEIDTAEALIDRIQSGIIDRPTALAHIHGTTESTTETTDQHRPVVDLVARIDDMDGLVVDAALASGRAVRGEGVAARIAASPTPTGPEPATESAPDLMKALRASVDAAKARRSGPATPEPTEETP
jgi:hypothetical protein